MAKIFAISLVCILLSACVTTKTINRASGPGWYTVKPSDTLFSIAWRYGLDYKELALWNNMSLNEIIHPGDRLLLVDPRKQSSVAVRDGNRSQTATRPASGQQSATTAPGNPGKKPAVAAPAETLSSPGSWIWPTNGPLMNSFLVTDVDRRGLNIKGKLKQPIKSIGGGRVVYSGNGLAGYGNLVIIKHSETYLSAYAHCQTRLVAEGDKVKKGQQIATMGAKDDVARLYFEIRKNGKPVDPVKLLPKR